MEMRNAIPVVSVVVPAYQASGDIADALDSVFAQTFSHFEVVVVNDGSPDTPQLKAALAPYWSRIRYIEQPNRGAGAARNSGIRATSAKYIAFLDADDLWSPECLRRQVGYLDTHPDCAAVYADAMIAGDSPLAGRRFMETAPSAGEPNLLALIEQRCNIPLSTVVARRDALESVGLFEEGLRRGQDFDLWLRLAGAGHQIGFQRVVVGTRRVRQSGLSGDAICELERAITVLDRFGRTHDLPVAERTAVRIRLLMLLNRLEIEHGKQRLIEGNFAAARHHMAAAQPKSLRLRATLLALRVAPQLLRRIYLAIRSPLVAPRRSAALW
jgi:glycosyltransferase involved in cell wall biosynthesis